MLIQFQMQKRRQRAKQGSGVALVQIERPADEGGNCAAAADLDVVADTQFLDFHTIDLGRVFVVVQAVGRVVQLDEDIATAHRDGMRAVRRGQNC
ncbi:hypothetical protein D3C72_1924590 [compost metagenome]